MIVFVGWGVMSGFVENWVYDGVYEIYVEDEEMCDKLRKLNL